VARYTTSRSASAFENLTSQIYQLGDLNLVDQTATRFAIVLMVEVPAGTELDLRSPISNLAAGEGQLSEQVSRLCRIVYHDNTVPMLTQPRVVGAQATGSDSILIEMHRHHGRIAYASSTELPIPAAGDIIEIRYVNPIAKIGAVYERLVLPTPNPGQPASEDLSDLIGPNSSMPYNALGDFALSEDLDALVAAGPSSVDPSYEINDPENEHYQLALTYAEHYDNKTFGEDTYGERNLGYIGSLHSSFQPYIKAFIAMCMENDVTIHGNSGYRSPAHQQRLYDEYMAADAAYKAANPQPGRPGGSWHGLGMAFDFNPVYMGQWLNSDKTESKGTVESWVASGVVAIVEDRLGIKWGGRWDNYDPIHIDCSNLFLGKNGLSSGYKTGANDLASRAGITTDANGGWSGVTNTFDVPAAT